MTFHTAAVSAMPAHVAPRLAEFPMLLSDSLPDRNLAGVPLNVVHEWLVHEFGEDELENVSGLPVNMIACLYPEADVATFSLIRGTTTLGYVQDLFDAFATALTEFEALEKLAVKHELDMLSMANTKSNASQRTQCYSPSPIANSLYLDINWAIGRVIHGEKGLRSVSPVWFEVFELALFLCAPYVVPVEKRAMYAELCLPYEGVLKALGLEDVWAKVSATVKSWAADEPVIAKRPPAIRFVNPGEFRGGRR